jgi:hypothetical protein
VTQINTLGTYTPMAINDQTTHLIELIVARSSAGSTGDVRYTVRFDNNQVATYLATGATAGFITSFDRVTFGSGFVEMPNIRIDNIVVSATAIPEPATLGGLAALAGGLMIRRRRA